MIYLPTINISYNKKPILINAELSLIPGQRYGLIGPNGCGKTSLMKYLSSIEGNTYCSQTEVCVMNESMTSTEWLHQSLDPDDEDFDKQKATSFKIMHELDIDSSKTISQMSGGQRMLLSLAKAVLHPSYLLLLDEPTNHLDYSTTVWLTSYLQELYSSKRYKDHILVIISHSPSLLNALCTKIISITTDHHLKIWNGDYNFYESQQLQSEMAIAKKVEKDIKTAKSKGLAFKHLKHPQSRKTSIYLGEDPETQLMGVIWESREVKVCDGEKIGIIGKNGSGKSFLIRAGTMPHQRMTSCSILKQIPTESDDQILTLIQTRYNVSEEEARKVLAKNSLKIKDRNQPLSSLSGGELTKFYLACIALEGQRLIILDEPTNNMDIDTVSALIDCIRRSKKTFIIISHNTDIIELCDRVFELYKTEEDHKIRQVTM
jgi:ATP-binding cassette subfamily F protein 3